MTQRSDEAMYEQWDNLIDFANLQCLHDCMECRVAPSPELCEWFFEARMRFRRAFREGEWYFLLQFVVLCAPARMLDRYLSEKWQEVEAEPIEGIMLAIMDDSKLAQLLENL